jgi:hypothetical protein
MARKRTLKLRCPTCKEPVKSGDAEFLSSPIKDTSESFSGALPDNSDED